MKNHTIELSQLISEIEQVEIILYSQVTDKGVKILNWYPSNDDKEFSVSHIGCNDKEIQVVNFPIDNDSMKQAIEAYNSIKL